MGRDKARGALTLVTLTCNVPDKPSRENAKARVPTLAFASEEEKKRVFRPPYALYDTAIPAVVLDASPSTRLRFPDDPPAFLNGGA